MSVRRGDFACNRLHCGDAVTAVSDPRHEGRVEFVSAGMARVRWIKTGWLSECPVHDLQVDHFYRFHELVDAHENEAQRKRAEIHNLGWATSDDGLCSKTSKGLLDTQRLRNGKIRHSWSRR